MSSECYVKLIQFRDYVMRIASEHIMYLEDWGPKYIIEHARDAHDYMKNVNRVPMLDFIKLTRDEVIAIGFYESKVKPGLFVVPVWMWYLIPDAGRFESACSNGYDSISYNFSSGNPLSRDSRGGFLAIGVRFNQDGSMSLSRRDPLEVLLQKSETLDSESDVERLPFQSQWLGRHIDFIFGELQKHANATGRTVIYNMNGIDRVAFPKESY